MEQKHSVQKHIIFFDGVCNLCNGFVDFLVRRDKKNVLYYAPLQGSTFKTLDIQSDSGHLSTIIYKRGDKIYFRSYAVLWILNDLGGVWKIMMLFIIVPPFLRDAVYKFIANNRYRFFGKKETCRLPTPEERARFLD